MQEQPDVAKDADAPLAGWYPKGDNLEGWWTGSSWSGHTRPMNDLEPPAAPTAAGSADFSDSSPSSAALNEGSGPAPASTEVSAKSIRPIYVVGGIAVAILVLILGIAIIKSATPSACERYVEPLRQDGVLTDSDIDQQLAECEAAIKENPDLVEFIE